MTQWTDGRSALATAFAIPDVETPSSRAVSARDSPSRARKLSRSSRAATICPCSPEDDVVRCPRGIQPCLSWHPRAGPRLESWGTPSELFLSVNNVPHYVVRAFVRFREMMIATKEVAAILGELERKVARHDEAIRSLVTTIRRLMNAPPPARTRRPIGFRVEEAGPRYRLRRSRHRVRSR